MKIQKTNCFLYTVYGLTIAAPLDIPGLVSGEGAVDLLVNFGSVPEILDASQDVSLFFQAVGSQILFKAPKVARFLILNGKEVVIEKEEGAEDDDVRLFLMGSVMGAVLHYRGITPLHGNGFIHNGEAVLTLGNAGVGKSTLAAALVKKGYTLLADDICAVKNDSDGRSMVIPGPPHVKLWKDSSDKIGVDTVGLRKIAGRFDKYIKPLHGTFCSHAVPLKRIYVLVRDDTPAVAVEGVSNIDGLFLVKRHTYRNYMIKAMGCEPAHFKRCGKIVKDALVRKITRPLHGFFLKELVESLENDLGR